MHHDVHCQCIRTEMEHKMSTKTASAIERLLAVLEKNRQHTRAFLTAMEQAAAKK